MAQRGDNVRRYPRLRTRCRVLVRDRYGVWQAETEDLGPRGCRIVTPRPQTVGTLVGLTVEFWAVRDRPSRAGISFAGSASRPGAPGPAAWFAVLAAAERAVEAIGTASPL